MAASRYKMSDPSCAITDPEGQWMRYKDVEELAKNYSDLYDKHTRVLEAKDKTIIDLTRKLENLRSVIFDAFQD